MGSAASHFFNPDGTPFEFVESAFDPMFGFEKTGRKLRENKVPEEHFASALIPNYARDYCGKELLAFEHCKQLNVPLMYRCNHLKHVHAQCQFEDYVVRMKEYERERRLMERAKRVGPERAGYKVAPAQG